MSNANYGNISGFRGVPTPPSPDAELAAEYGIEDVHTAVDRELDMSQPREAVDYDPSVGVYASSLCMTSIATLLQV